ncbi:MAG: hypothetical protein WD575_02655, partial [Nitriliruptoraceae bacterium]
MLAHLAVAVTAGVVTAGATPLVVRVARRFRVTDHPVEHRPGPVRHVPTLGGLAMFVGFLVAMGLAWSLPTFRPLFTSTS